MIERMKKLGGKCDWLAPETGAVALGYRFSGQNDPLEANFENTPSLRQTRRVNFGRFFSENGSLPRQALKDLERGAGQNAEHQVAHDLGRTSDADEECAEVVFELGVDPFRSRALFETSRGRRVHGDFFTAAWIEVNDGNMSELSAKGVNFFGVVSGVHEVVEAGNPLPAHLSQGDGHLRVVEGSGGEDGADRNIDPWTGVRVFWVLWVPVRVCGPVFHARGWRWRRG